MDILIYVIITTVLCGQAFSRPGWHNNHLLLNRLHHFQAIPVIHHDGLFTGFHEEAQHSGFPTLDLQGHELFKPYHGHVAVLTHGPIAVPDHGPVAVPLVLPSGHLADTPEVSAAKEHHLSAVAQARADKYYSGHSDSNYGGAYGYSGSYHGYAVPVVLPNGHIADTEEVAAAKSAHLLAVAKTKAEKYYSGHGEGYGYGDYGYSGSYHGYGIPVVLPNGHLADTHEVAAAKNAHLVAVEHAKAEQAHAHQDHPQFYMYVPYATDEHSYSHGHYSPIYQ